MSSLRFCGPKIKSRSITTESCRMLAKMNEMRRIKMTESKEGEKDYFVLVNQITVYEKIMENNVDILIVIL